MGLAISGMPCKEHALRVRGSSANDLCFTMAGGSYEGHVSVDSAAVESEQVLLPVLHDVPRVDDLQVIRYGLQWK